MEKVEHAIKLRELSYLYEPWMLWIFVSAMALLAIYRIQFPNYLQIGRWNLGHYRIAKQLFAEGEFGLRIDWLIGFPVMAAGISLFIFLAQKAYNPCVEGFVSYLIVFGVISLALILKMLAISGTQTFGTSAVALRVYFGNTIILTQLTSFILLALSLIIALSYDSDLEIYIWIGFGILLLNYLVRLIRGTIAAFQERISLNYIILYLCTLEILPLAVLVKAWMSAQTTC